MRDLESNDVETAAYLARMEDDGGYDPPSRAEYEDEPEVLVCGEVGHGYYDSDKGCPDCAQLVPVTVADFAPPTAGDEDVPF